MKTESWNLYVVRVGWKQLRNNTIFEFTLIRGIIIPLNCIQYNNVVTLTSKWSWYDQNYSRKLVRYYKLYRLFRRKQKIHGYWVGLFSFSFEMVSFIECKRHRNKKNVWSPLALDLLSNQKCDFQVLRIIVSSLESVSLIFFSIEMFVSTVS